MNRRCGKHGKPQANEKNENGQAFEIETPMGWLLELI